MKFGKTARISLLLFTLILCLCACKKPQPTPTEPTPRPSTTAAPTPAPTPEPTVEIPTEPLLEAAGRIVLNGAELTLWQHEGEALLLAQEAASALGAELSQQGDVLILRRGFDMAELSALRAEGQQYLSLQALIEPFAVSRYTDEETGLCYYTPDAARFEIPEIRDVPVLMYHAVSDELWGIEELFVSPKSMEAQLQYLVQNGYQPIWFEDLRHIEQYEKPVILTFDDGYLDNYTELFPLLQKYGVKATVFVIARDIGKTNKMNEAQIREMDASGLVSIQCHSYSHGYLGQMDRQTLEFEFSESKKILTRLTGKEPSVLCYPSGSYSALCIEVARGYFGFGIKMQGGMYRTDADPFLVNRYYVSRWTSLQGFASYLGS